LRSNPLLAYVAILISMGVAFTLLHGLISWLNLSDLIALLIFAIPIAAYTAYCTHNSPRRALHSAIWIYGSFAGVVLASASLVYLIG